MRFKAFVFWANMASSEKFKRNAKESPSQLLNNRNLKSEFNLIEISINHDNKNQGKNPKQWSIKKKKTLLIRFKSQSVK